MSDKESETLSHDDAPLVAKRAAPSETVAHEVTPLAARRIVAEPNAVLDRYRLGAELARGGMGVVHFAEDIDFGREIAIKVLAPNLVGTPSAARFLAEAKITGQLQHPGVPPVHEVGHLPDGRPFLAMKLIKGHTLADLLKDRSDPRADRDKFEQIFEQICQTVAFAHARGVIHRDLKPQNVMVGAFGEVQVMDWGLAKDLNSSAPSELDLVPISFDPDLPQAQLTDATQAGAILGTPAYMPPEQARGEIDKLGARADVFALGAILCVMLTGKPPYSGSSSAVVWRKAAAADLSDALARLRDCKGPNRLVLLCKRCLDPKPSVRPAHAGELAAAVHLIRTSNEQFTRQSELDNAVAEAKIGEMKGYHQGALGVSIAIFAVVLACVVSLYAMMIVDDRVAAQLEKAGSMPVPKNEPAAKPSVTPPKVETKLEPKADPKKAPERVPNEHARAEAATLLRLTEAWLTVPNPALFGQLTGIPKPLSHDEKRDVRAVRLQYDRLVLDLQSKHEVFAGYVLLAGLFESVGEKAEADAAWQSALAVHKSVGTTDSPLMTAIERTAERVRNRRQMVAGDRAVLNRCAKCLRDGLRTNEFALNHRIQAPYAFEKMAQVWNSVQQSTRAAENWEAAADALHAETERDLNDFFTHKNAAKCYLQLARNRHAASDDRDALKHLLKARPHVETSLKLSRQSEEARQAIRDHVAFSAEVRLGLKDHARASADADELAGMNLEWVNDTYSAARVLARCVPLVADDGTLDAVEKKVLARQYADRAMRVLQKCVDRGYQIAKSLKEDAAFGPLKDRVDFQKIVADLDEKLDKSKE